MLPQQGSWFQAYCHYWRTVKIPSCLPYKPSLRWPGYLSSLLVMSASLSACVSGLWTGATMAYDRNQIYKKIDDYAITHDVQDALSIDSTTQGSPAHIEVATFNGDVVIAGNVPSEHALQTARKQLKTIEGARSIYNDLQVTTVPANVWIDSWITMKIRSGIFADASIPPKSFKIVTVNRTVYILGEAQTQDAARVLDIAKNTQGVTKIVKLIHYYQLS